MTTKKIEIRELPLSLKQRVLELVDATDGGKIAAIRYYREQAGAGLREAKEAVEAIMAAAQVVLEAAPWLDGDGDGVEPHHQRSNGATTSASLDAFLEKLQTELTACMHLATTLERVLEERELERHLAFLASDIWDRLYHVECDASRPAASSAAAGDASQPPAEADASTRGYAARERNRKVAARRRPAEPGRKRAAGGRS